MADKVYDPPPGPPPGYDASRSQDTPPYHNWQEVVPDTTTFPPPPITGFYSSGTGNASIDDADRAHDFCNRVPLWTPAQPSPAVYGCVESGDLRPVRPREFAGQLTSIGRGRWRGASVDRGGDCIILTHLPLYFPLADSPFVTEKRKVIYFEVRLLRRGLGPSGDDGSADSSGFAIGFAAQPYPTWRSPGWERGSLGVFSDDGCRFVNDSWGGKEFVRPFRDGDTVGIGMEFSLPEKLTTLAGGGAGAQLNARVFCTRNGRQEGEWDLHEEMDAESGSIHGLAGDYDLYGAVGLFGGAAFEVCHDRSQWLYRP